MSRREVSGGVRVCSWRPSRASAGGGDARGGLGGGVGGWSATQGGGESSFAGGKGGECGRKGEDGFGSCISRARSSACSPARCRSRRCCRAPRRPRARAPGTGSWTLHSARSVPVAASHELTRRRLTVSASIPAKRPACACAQGRVSTRNTVSASASASAHPPALAGTYTRRWPRRCRRLPS